MGEIFVYPHRQNEKVSAYPAYKVDRTNISQNPPKKRLGQVEEPI
jgi:hypothetical protein